MKPVTIWSNISTSINYYPNNNPEKFEKSLLSSQIIDFPHCATPGEEGVRIEYIRNACGELKKNSTRVL